MSSTQQVSLIGVRYAASLFDMAAPAKALDAVLADLESLVKLEKESADFRTLLTSPLITRAQAQAALETILAKGKANDITKKFLAMLAANRRLDLLSGVAVHFAELVEQSHGEVTADVEAASALSPEIQKQVAASLAKATGKKVKLRIQENASLLGGLVVRFGGKRLDLSVAGQLDRLSQALKRA